MSPRAYLFDLCDTLVDLVLDRLPTIRIGGRRIPSTCGALHTVISEHSSLDLESFARALGEVDRELTARVLQAGRELPTLERFGELVRRLGLEAPGLAEQLTLTHMAKIRETACFPPGHAAVLRELGNGTRLGVCSNFSHAPTARAFLADAGLLGYLDAVVISEEVGVRKPRAEIFEAAMEQLGVSPQETCHVGDDLVADVAGAGALGITTIWVTRRVPEPQEALRRHTGPPPAHVVSDLAEIPGLLSPSSG